MTIGPMKASFNTLVFVTLAGLVLAGCVERELTITSQPPGAVVELSGEEIGRTPVTKSFTHYGDYDVVLRLNGYEALKTDANLRVPWYEVIPIDLFAEIAPWTTHDRRYVHYELKKMQVPADTQASDRADQEMIQKAQDLRQQANTPVAR